MPASFTEEKIKKLRSELWDLYVLQNKPLGEIARLLSMSESGLYGRLKRCNIPIRPWRKERYLNKTKDVKIPDYSADLAEFVGIMLGDGHINPTQIIITLNSLNDRDYYAYVKSLASKLFGIKARSTIKKEGTAIDCYVNSVVVVRFLKKMGLVQNKVKMQVIIPFWIFRNRKYQRACLRGLIDTDGSVYRIRSGIQISFKNKSVPLLEGIRKLFIMNDFHPSRISANTVYLTRRDELDRYFQEVGTSNVKHLNRYYKFSGRIA